MSGFQTCVSLMNTISKSVTDACANCWTFDCFIYFFHLFLFCAQFYWIWDAFPVVSDILFCYNSWISLLGSVKCYLMDWLLWLSDICESVSVLCNGCSDLDFSTWYDLSLVQQMLFLLTHKHSYCCSQAIKSVCNRAGTEQIICLTFTPVFIVTFGIQWFLYAYNCVCICVWEKRKMRDENKRAANVLIFLT